MTPHRCVAFDLTIESDFPVMGATEHCPDLAKCDARIRWLAPVAPTGPAPPVWSGDGETLWFSPDNLARYRCRSDLVEITPASGALAGDISALLVATALPAMLWLRGTFVLHAAAAVPHGYSTALAISGRSGIGKSTLVRELVSQGACLVADDSIAVRTDGDLSCAGLAGGYHLGVDGEGERRFHRLPVPLTRRAAALAAVVVLDDDPGIISPRRLNTVEAMVALLANRHRPNVPRFGGFELRSLRDAALLAESRPVYTWPRNTARALLDADVLRATMEGRHIDE